MFNFYKDHGLLLGECVFNILLSSPGYQEADDTHGNIEIVAEAATLGGDSAYRFRVRDGHIFRRYAWVKQNSVTDGIDVVLGTESNTQYDEKRGQIPLENAPVIELYHDEHYRAAQAIYEFMVRGKTTVRRIHRNPFQP